MQEPPYNFDNIDHEQIHSLLKNFVSIISFPLFIINLKGEIVAGLHAHDTHENNKLFEFHVNTEEHVVIVKYLENHRYINQETLSMPITLHEESIGYVVALTAPFTDDKEDGLEKIQLIVDIMEDKLAAEYKISALTHELLEEHSELTLIYDLSEELSAVYDVKTICDIVIHQIVEIIGVEKASIILYDEPSHSFCMAASYGFDLSHEESRHILVTPEEYLRDKTFFAENIFFLKIKNMDCF
jgi:hypothetical protein